MTQSRLNLINKKHMKRILSIVSLICLIFLMNVQAQLPGNRTTSTIIADALSLLPSATPDQFELLMADLVSTGEEGLLQLVKRMNPTASEYNTTLQNALTGWTAYALRHPEFRAMTTEAYRKALKISDDKSIIAFINHQLERINKQDSVASPTALTDQQHKTEPKVRATTNAQATNASPELVSVSRKKDGFVPLFDGKTLKGWKGLVGNPITRSKMSKSELRKAQKEANKEAAASWVVENGELIFTGTGNNLCTKKLYGDFEMLVDWKLYPGKEPDAGIYLRGTPQVQIWDTARVNVGAQVGSGGLYNNKVNPSNPLKVADLPIGTWNTFRIIIIGERVTVYLNGELVTNNVILENYWDRTLPIFTEEQIELQAHGSKVAYRNIYIREIPQVKPYRLPKKEAKQGFEVLFDGTTMHKWTGNTTEYITEEGNIVLYPGNLHGGNLFTKEEFDNFVFRFEFQLTPGANNGLGIRTPMEGDPAYVGMELQILDNEAPVYSQLDDYQYHGSVYGIIPAKRGFLKPTGEWNYQEVIADGDNIKITLNGTVILEGNLKEATKNGTLDKKDHPGLFNKKGHIGFLGHGSKVKFRNIRVKRL